MPAGLMHRCTPTWRKHPSRGRGRERGSITPCRTPNHVLKGLPIPLEVPDQKGIAPWEDVAERAEGHPGGMLQEGGCQVQRDITGLAVLRGPPGERGIQDEVKDGVSDVSGTTDPVQKPWKRSR